MAIGQPEFRSSKRRRSGVCCRVYKHLTPNWVKAKNLVVLSTDGPLRFHLQWLTGLRGEEFQNCLPRHFCLVSCKDVAGVREQHELRPGNTIYDQLPVGGWYQPVR